MSMAVLAAGSKLAGDTMKTANAIGGALMAGSVAKSQKKLLKEKEKTVKMRAEFNEKEIMENFINGYKANMVKYADKVQGVFAEKGAAASESLMKATNKSANVVLAGSSFHNSEMMEINTQFEQATSQLMENQTSEANRLASQKEQQLTNNQLGLIDFEKQMTNEKLSIESDKNQKIMQGAASAIEGFGEVAKGYDGLKTELGNKTIKTDKPTEGYTTK